MATGAGAPRPIRPSLIQPEALQRLGQVLYGGAHGWQAALARDLPISLPTVEAWLSGARPIHADHLRNLLALIDQRGEHIAGLGDEFAAALAGAMSPGAGGAAPEGERRRPSRASGTRLRWQIERRMDLIDARLAAGALNRADITAAFGVSPVQATVDLRLFARLYPDAMVYDGRRKVYLPAETPYRRRRAQQPEQLQG